MSGYTTVYTTEGIGHHSEEWSRPQSTVLLGPNLGLALRGCL